MAMQPADYPIRKYGLIGNCETAALLNSDGGIDWLCLPAFDGPSFFGALLDREKGGEFSIRPAGEFRIEQAYSGETAILETRFISEHSTVLLTDFFVIARKKNARFYDYTSLHPTRKLVRLLRIERGDQAMLDVRVAARPDYARAQAEWRAVAGGFASREASLFSNLPLVQCDGDLACRAVLEAGKSYFAVLDYADARTEPSLDQVQAWLETTKAFWNEWNLFNYYRGAHEKVVRRSAVTLKLLTYAPTGAFVAAPTTSLPEKPGGESNWDYRYTWVRDTALFINTLFCIGYSGEAKAFFQFVCKDRDRDQRVRRSCRCSFQFATAHQPTRRSSIISPGTPVHVPCEPGTERQASYSSITTATSSSHSSTGNTPAESSALICVEWANARSRSCGVAGANPTTAFGSQSSGISTRIQKSAHGLPSRARWTSA